MHICSQAGSAVWEAVTPSGWEAQLVTVGYRKLPLEDYSPRLPQTQALCFLNSIPGALLHALASVNVTAPSWP